MRASRHNGRSGAHGTYNPKHNDREFDISKSDDINPALTANNIYWNCHDRELVRHGDLNENHHSFTEVEANFYELVYKDYLDNQNNRHLASGHKERCRTMDDLRTNAKTCPEETIYQIGNIDKHVEYGTLVEIAAEFFNEISKRYGNHVHTLDWALHLDEGTPHIHERHVFDVVNKYGERQPKQEQALKELGFKLPDSTKKTGKYNNLKMSYDAECRKLFLEICKKHGLEIEEAPIYGGRKYLEKQEYIIEKLNENIKDLQARYDSIDELYTKALQENERLSAINEKLEMKIEDVEGLLKEVSDIAYDKACETLVDEIVEKTQAEDMKQVDNYKKWIASDKCKMSARTKNLVATQLDNLNLSLRKCRYKVICAVRKALEMPAKKKKFAEEIIEKARPSTLELLRMHKARIDEENADKRKQSHKNRGEIDL